MIPVRLSVFIILVCSIIAFLVIAGCTYNIQNADGSFNKSFSTNPGTGSGTGSSGGTGGGISGGKSGGSGSSTGSTRVPDTGSMKAHFSVDCTRTLVDDQPDHTDTWTAKLNGNAPLMVSRNWNAEPAISSPQFYWTSFTEGGEKPTLHAEWIRICKSPPCTPCHFVYDGPAEIGASIRHDPKNAPAEWTALLTGIGSPTHEAVSDGQMDQYTTNTESTCTVTDNHFMTVSLYLQSDNCFDTQYAPVTGYEKSFTLGDGSMITYTSNDPKANLDSTAVFHFGA